MKAVVALALSAGAAIAASAQECRTIENKELRLACYDQANGTAFPAATTPQAAPASANNDSGFKQFLSELRLADESTPKGLGSDPATISWARRDGEDFSTIKAALIWESTYSPFPNESYLARMGWGPVVSLSVNRNSLSTKKADARQANVGLQGTAFAWRANQLDARGNRWLYAALHSKLTAGYRENKVDATESNLFTADNVLVTDYLRYGLPYQSPFAVLVLPRFGLVHEDVRRAKAGVPTGNFNSVYGILKVEAFPALISDRLRVSLTAQRFVDFDVDGGNTKRRETYGKAAIDYLLYSPFESPTVKPSFGLERTIGADPLNASPRFGQTQFVIRLKIN